MSGKKQIVWFAVGVVVTLVVLLLVIRIPAVYSRVEWRLDRAAGIVRGWLYPGDTIPVPDFASSASNPDPDSPPAPVPSPTPELKEEEEASEVQAPELPASFSLPAPEWEKQDWNNCGPAVLSMALRYYGWDGDQFDISDYNKPDRADKNVNITELTYYVKNFAGWLDADYRVGGSVDTLRSFIAAGYPVVIEVSNNILEGGGGWAAHYLLVTGYDDQVGELYVENSYIREENVLTYEDLEDAWRPFNYLYMVVYPPENRDQIDEVLGQDLEREANRLRSLELAESQIAQDPGDAFAWFNKGTNLTALERYEEASQAFDQAFLLGLPWRFMRYQFGPYIAYFNSGRFEDVIELADITLQRTPNSEEALLWRGWGYYQVGDVNAAAADFRKAYETNPSYEDARYALDFLGISP